MHQIHPYQLQIMVVLLLIFNMGVVIMCLNKLARVNEHVNKVVACN